MAEPLSIAVTGASGFLGAHLSAHWRAAGHRILALPRGTEPKRAEAAWWDPDKRRIHAAALEGLDVIVHLAGEPIGRRWTPSRRRRILESRRDGTRFLAETLTSLDRPPRVFVCASAIGYYGDRADEILTEASHPGDDFLAQVCQAWEAATEPARAAGIRTLRLRQGIVLGRDGGALARMLLPFRLGLGGRLGHGHQYWSWISLTDLVRAYDFVIERRDATGPFNAVAPLAVTNAVFTRTLARVLRRPAAFPVPQWALKIRFGGMAEGALLASQHAVPERLMASGFKFERADLEAALRHELRKSSNS